MVAVGVDPRAARGGALVDRASAVLTDDNLGGHGVTTVTGIAPAAPSEHQRSSKS